MSSTCRLAILISQYQYIGNRAVLVVHYFAGLLFTMRMPFLMSIHLCQSSELKNCLSVINHL